MATDNLTPGLYIVYTIFLVLALVAMVLRLISRRIARLSLWWDDYFILAATVIHSAGFGFLLYCNELPEAVIPPSTNFP